MAIPKFMPMRLEKMGATITNLADDAIEFITKQGDTVKLRFRKNGKGLSRGSVQAPDGSYRWSYEINDFGSQRRRKPDGYLTSCWRKNANGTVRTEVKHDFVEGTRDVHAFQMKRTQDYGNMDTFEVTGHIRRTNDGSVKVAYTKVHDNVNGNVSMGQGMRIIDDLPFAHS